ncbi:hypothetical protein JW898_03425 [Candidatus Woesearchaeota archaeon]|nr:hypothetical protein [Candidatus Woesearchaeota archaeon]
MPEKYDDQNHELLRFSASSLDYDAFLHAADAYVCGVGPEPVVEALSVPSSIHNSDGGAPVSIHFEDGLLRMMVRAPSYFKKYMNSLRYGYIGRSRGGRNGIVHVDDSSQNHLVMRIASFMVTDKGLDLLVRRAIEEPEAVKVVAHRKNGDRVVGIRDRRSGDVFLYGIENYSH